jgi:hypothetical protein
MNNYEEIKRLVESSRKIFSNINESDKSDIRKKYGLLTEQPDQQMGKELENSQTDKKKDSEEVGKKSEKQKGYKIQGNILILHGESEANLQLTTDEKNAFIESVDEFRSGVAELVKFDNMNVYSENVEWSGKIQELDLEFFYTINEPQGIYINAQMVKVDEPYLESINKLQSYYEKFKTKWSKIVASRQEKK